MLYYLDTVIVIYAVEGNDELQHRAIRRLGEIEGAGHQFAVSDLTLTECLVPFESVRTGDRLADLLRFFAGPNLRTLEVRPSAYRRAAAIRGAHHYLGGKKYGLADALHLAVAIESGCDVFLTNDLELRRFQDIAIETLP